MRLASHECRWFLDGTPSDEVVERFKRAGDWKRDGNVVEPAWPEKWREDRYMVLPADAEPAKVDLGIKLRAEPGYPTKLEFKGRTSSFGPVALGPRAVGVIERWIKWSYAGAEVPESLLAPFSEDQAGVLVRKLRIQRKIRLTAFGSTFGDEVEVPTDVRNEPSARVDRGLLVELTQLETEAHGESWTFGFEAFPQDTEIHEDFRRNALRFLDGFAGVVDLSQERSMSYPEWLSQL